MEEVEVEVEMKFQLALALEDPGNFQLAVLVEKKGKEYLISSK